MTSRPDDEPAYLFRVTNWHSADCGQPPTLDGDTPHCRYSYFQDEHGEQAIFEYNMDKKAATLWMGDAGWDEPQTVIDGQVPELILTPAEALWLTACWHAATGEVPKHLKRD